MRAVVLEARGAEGLAPPIPVGTRIRLPGVLTGYASIDGAAFVIDRGTRVDDRPNFGDQAKMRGTVPADGSVRAGRVCDR